MPRAIIYRTLKDTWVFEDFPRLALAAAQGQSRSASTIPASEIPHLQKQGTATQLIVDGKPFLALSGELFNNSATSLEFMKPAWPKLAEAKLNSVVAGVSWAQIEPQEGKFDFSVPDGVIREAKSHDLRLILIWFASWKNGYSSYLPDWLKKDFERFPRAQITGDKSIELLSPSRAMSAGWPRRAKPNTRCRCT